jgi:hypothetical protein
MPLSLEEEAMKRLMGAVLMSVALSFAFAPVVHAADQATAAAKSAYKVGDKVYVCGCGSCECSTLSAAKGKCHCGKDLIEGTVTKVADGEVTVKTVSGERTLKAR